MSEMAIGVLTLGKTILRFLKFALLPFHSRSPRIFGENRQLYDVHILCPGPKPQYCIRESKVRVLNKYRTNVVSYPHGSHSGRLISSAYRYVWARAKVMAEQRELRCNGGIC